MMADTKENMDPVTHQLSAVDNDMHKSADVQEKTVASVALGMSKRNDHVVLDANVPKAAAL